MTKKELSQLYYLNREIEYLKNRIRELDEKSVSNTHKISGMPSGTDILDLVGDCVVEIDELKLLLDVKLKQCIYEVNIINRYINSIGDSRMRMIISLRYINGLSWQQVAASIGGGNTEKNVQMGVNRFLKMVTI
jgi:hypothetical protein